MKNSPKARKKPQRRQGQGLSIWRPAQLSRTRISIFVLAFALIAASILIFAHASSTPTNFYGTNWHPMWINAGGQNAEMDLMQQAGVKTIRIDAEWYFMEPSKGSYHPTYLARFDNAVSGLLSRGIEPLIIITSTPTWVTGAPSTDPDAMHEPPVRSNVQSGCDPTQYVCSTYDHSADYNNFLSFLMNRYAGKVHNWEIWNEPDGQWSWRKTETDYLQAATNGGTDYTTLLKSAYATAKSIDPQSVILGGSLSQTQLAQQTFLKSMYAHGAKNSFDVYSQHYYCDPPNDNWCNSDRSIDDPQTLANTFTNGMVPILQSNGDGSKPVWVTETGYNTGPSGVSESVQADYLTKSFNVAKTLPNVARLYWYDTEESNTGTDAQSYYGIIAADMYNADALPSGWRLKPAYTALQLLATSPTSTPSSTPTPTASATPTPPTTTPTPTPAPTPTPSPVATPLTTAIVAPANNSKLGGTTTIKVRDSSNVVRSVLTWDSKNIIRDATSQSAFGWGSGWDTSKAPNGRHTITDMVYDASGHTAQASITVNVYNNVAAAGAIVGIGSKCLDNRYDQMSNGNKIELWSCNGGDAQKWTVHSAAGPIVNANGYCLDVQWGGISAGTLVQLYQCNGTPAQQWSINKATGTIVNPVSGLCLDDKHSSTTNGNQIWIFTCNGSTAQKWASSL